MQKTVNGLVPFEYQKISKEEQEKRGILGRLVGIIADPNKPTRNSRLYDKNLWQKVINDPIFNEKLENRVLFGEFEHPLDGRTSIEPKNITVCLAEKPKFGKDGYLYGVFDILNTECGKLLKTLLDYGSTFAISSRGDGDLFTNSKGQEQVDPDTYQCFAFDIVGVPGVKEARLTPVMESFDGTNKKTLNESLFELYNKSTDKEVIMETLNNLGIALNEEVNYDALTKQAKELLGTRYGNIVNNTGLRKALKKAINDNKEQDYQSISKLLTIYDKDFTEKHSIVKDLANGKKLKTASDSDSDLILDADSEMNLDDNSASTAEISDSNETSTEQSTKETNSEQDSQKQENFEKKIVYNNINESRDWTEDECRKVGELLKSAGLMSYDEFKKALDSGEFNVNSSNKSAEHIDAKDNQNNKEVGNSMSAIIDSLQEALKTKQDMEAKVLELNEKLSVCYAKEAKQESVIAKLQENLTDAENANKEISKYKSRTEKQSALIENANQTIRELNTKCNDVITKYNTLAEKYNSNRSKMSSLNENLSSQSNKISNLVESNNSLKEDLAKLNNELNENKKAYSTKLQESNELVEKYKKVATRAINKYIDSQALKLDITSQEIKNKLPENYTFNDIDSICESLQNQKVSMNLLPFKTHNKIYESMNVGITGKLKKEPILDEKSSLDDDIDDSLMTLAKM